MRFSSTILALVPFITSVLAQENCDIVSNVTVVSGDSLGAIATTAGVTLNQVLYVNPTITNANFINVGDIIAIPNAACVAPEADDPVEPIATCSNGTATTYTVVAGDTFTIIANEKLGITLAALVAANPDIADVNLIVAGDVLNVPVCAATTTLTSTDAVTEKKFYYDCLTTKVSKSRRNKSSRVRRQLN